MTMVVVIILWFMLSFVIANAASQRGCGAFAWFVFSILISPILAALFLLLFPPALQQAGSHSVNDGALREAIEAPEPRNRERTGALIASLAIVFVVLGVVGSLVVERIYQTDTGSSSPTENKASHMTLPQARPYEAVAHLTCVDLLNALDTSRSSELVDPVVEVIGQHDEFGTPINRTSYLLTECRLREGQTIGKAVDNLFEQKRLGRLPQIPIGGATSEAYVRAIWVPFDKWVRHQGPRPNFAKTAGF
jgi:hypothetical protein